MNQMLIGRMACHHFIKLTTPILFIICILVSYGTDACMLLVSNPIGHITPGEDFMIEVGSPLVLNCHLYLENAKKHNPDVSSKNIRFKLFPKLGEGRAKIIPSKYYRYINSTTTQLYIKNATMDHNGKYACYISTLEKVGPPAKYNNMLICATGVAVGYPPLDIDKDGIQCRSANWHNMTCTWEIKNNTIPTTYKFYYSYFRFGSGEIECKPQKNIRNQCFMTVDVSHSNSTTNFYRQVTRHYYFTIRGENIFGKSENEFQLDHYNYVIPNPPDVYFVQSVHQRSMKLEWLPPSGLEGFPVGLKYEVSFKSQWDDKWMSVLTEDNTLMINNLLPHTIYVLRLRCISGSIEISNGEYDQDLWSNYTILQQITKPDVPRIPPNVTAGMFEEIQNNHSSRAIIVYWKHVLPQFRNGENFQYRVSYIESGGVRKRSVDAEDNTETTEDFYVRFNNLSPQLSYDFYVRVGNKEGYLPNVYSTIRVLDDRRILQKPTNFQVKILKDNSYHLSWEPPASNANAVKSYTVFYCKQRARYYNIRCKQPLNWYTVPASQHEINLPLSDAENTYYQFSVSSNGESTSSGMAWTSCINGVVDRVSVVSVVPVGTTSLKVSWNSACFKEKKLIIGFNIMYCKFSSQKSCYGPNLQKFVTVDNAILDGLESDQKYAIRVAYIHGNNIISEYSDPVMGKTIEGVPEALEAPIVLETESSSILISWEKAKKPNGKIIKYRVMYNEFFMDVNDSAIPVYHLALNESILPYTSYALSVRACTKAGCSEPENVAFAKTAVGVPGVMESPRYDIINETFVLVFWKKPLLPNGELSAVELMVDGYTRTEDGEYEPKTDIYRFTEWRNKTFVVIECPLFNNYIEMHMYNLTIRAGNRVNNETLYGPWSTSTRVNKCFPPVEGNWIAAIVGSILGAALLMFCVLFFYLTRCRKSDNHVTKKIVLPIGLDSKSMMNAYKDFSSGLKSTDINNGSSPETYGVYMPLVRNSSTLRGLDSVNKHLDECNSYSNSTQENQDADDHSRNTECSDDSGTADLPNKICSSTNNSNADLVITDDLPSNPSYCKLGFSHMRGPYVPAYRDTALFLSRKIAGSEPNIAEPNSPVDPDSGNSSVVHSVFPPYTQLGLASSHIDISKTVPVPVSYSDVNKNLSSMDPYVSMSSFTMQNDNPSPNFFPAAPYSKFGLLNIPTKESIEKNPGNPYVRIEPVRKWDIPKSCKGGIIPVQRANVTFNNPPPKIAENCKSPSAVEGYSLVSAIPDMPVPVPQNIESLPEPTPILCVPTVPGKSTGAIPKTNSKLAKNIPQKKLPPCTTNGYIPCNPLTSASSNQNLPASTSDCFPNDEGAETTLLNGDCASTSADSYTPLSFELGALNNTATSTPRTSPTQLPKVAVKQNHPNSKTSGYVPNTFCFAPSSRDTTQPLSCANLPIL